MVAWALPQVLNRASRRRDSGWYFTDPRHKRVQLHRYDSSNVGKTLVAPCQAETGFPGRRLRCDHLWTEDIRFYRYCVINDEYLYNWSASCYG